MDLAAALELNRRGIAAWLASTAASSEGASLFERDGVAAAIAPAVPDRSVINSVTYRGAAALTDALDDLAAAYEAAGVRAWTVWTPDGDRDAIALLEGAGHVFDAKPWAMNLDLAELPDPALGDLDWDAQASVEEVGLLNDLAYGYPEGTFAAAIGSPPPALPLRRYRARVEGDAASVLGTLDAGSDCVILFVATAAEHRGKGLAGRLLHAALAEAHERGQASSTLQATTLGFPVYERLGYRTVCRLHMYERRQPARDI
jgi:GNAT superfamily N-acetyltransferase